MRHRIMTAALLAAGLAAPAGAQDMSEPGHHRPDAFVAATRSFAFYSDPRVNLHDLLVRRLDAEQPADARTDCVAALPATQRDAFERAADYYRRTLSGRVPGHDDVMLDLRFHLIGYPGVEIGPDSVVAAAVERLDAALPAYRACWWADHDARNRGWIAGMLPRLIPLEDTMATRLARRYANEWKLPVPVDVVRYVSWSGANTIVNPDHILISSDRPSLRGDLGLEILFHEASHTLVNPRFGAIAAALTDAAEAAGLDAPPDPLWHVIIFYTTGRTLQSLLAERGQPGYEPYAYSQGVFARAWPEYIAPMELHWQAYLEGRIGLDEAARRVVEALRDVGQR